LQKSREITIIHLITCFNLHLSKFLIFLVSHLISEKTKIREHNPLMRIHLSLIYEKHTEFSRPMRQAFFNLKKKYLVHNRTKINRLNTQPFQKNTILNLTTPLVFLSRKKRKYRPRSLSGVKTLSFGILRHSCIFRGWYVRPMSSTLFYL
jgi:hypothetical protein